MDNIYEKQNVEENFRLKICFKYYYDKAKIFYNVNLVISLIIPTIAFFAKILKLEYKDFILSVSSCWIIIAMILNIWEQKLRINAVTLQEKYDINVLGLKENKTLMFKKIPIDKISLIVKAMKYGRNIDRIYYDEIECNDNTLVMLLAQRQNVLSDRILRERYCLIYKILLAVIVVSSISTAIILNQTVKEFLIEILIPLISLISFVIQQIRKLSEEVKRNEQIGELIESDILEFKKLNENLNTVYLIKSREYQNYIFTRRLNAALIPNIIYRVFKNTYVNGREINEALTSEARNVQ